MGTPLPKNGHDQAQDRAITTLTSELRAHIKRDDEQLVGINESMMSMRGTIDKYIFAGRVAWAFVAVIGTIIMAYQVNLNSSLVSLENRVDKIEARQQAFEERGTKWGESLDGAVREIRADIREIRDALSRRTTRSK